MSGSFFLGGSPELFGCVCLLSCCSFLSPLGVGTRQVSGVYAAKKYPPNHTLGVGARGEIGAGARQRS